MAKLTDPNKVAETLKAHKGNRTRAALALQVSRTALSKYIPKHIDIDCDYRVRQQTVSISAVPGDAPDTTRTE